MAGLNWWIRKYIYADPKIENPTTEEFQMDKKDLVYGVVRVGIGVIGSAFAVVLSFISTYISLVILLLQALILITPGMVAWLTNSTGLINMKLKGRLAREFKK